MTYLHTLMWDSIMQPGFFDLDNRYDQLSKLKDPLVEQNRVIDWNLFADLLAEITTKP